MVVLSNNTNCLCSFILHRHLYMSLGITGCRNSVTVFGLTSIGEDYQEGNLLLSAQV